MMQSEALEAVRSNPLWYHTMELAPGVVTPGWFDLRPVMDLIPWPDVRGKRCLDVGTYDGNLAFELERRGAAEVWATDVAHHDDWDWLPRERAKGVEYLAHIAGEKGRGFEIAAEILGSKVQRKFVSVYDLDPADLGQFDVVTCGSLLLHLRDPFRALEAIRRVCRGEFLSIEVFDPLGSIVQRRRPGFFLYGDQGQWSIPNLAGQRHMLDLAGFDIIRMSRPFAEPQGEAHPVTKPDLHMRLTQLICRAKGVPVRAVLCKPAIIG